MLADGRQSDCNSDVPWDTGGSIPSACTSFRKRPLKWISRRKNPNMGEVHPNVHEAWRGWSADQTLHVIAVYQNPFRWRTRRELFHNFCEHMRATSNVALHVVEVAFGDRPFEVSTPADIQLRTRHVLWLKENAINVAVQRLPADWKYAAYVDGDFNFTRQDWALETIHALQHYPWVQTFSSYAALGPEHIPLRVRPSFAYVYRTYPMFTVSGGCDAGFVDARPWTREGFVDGRGSQPKPPAGKTAPAPVNGVTQQRFRKLSEPGATGGAWAWTREGFSSVGGLLDTCILGSGDWHVAFGLVGDKGLYSEGLCTPAYVDSITRWQRRAYAAIHGRIG